MVVVEEVESIGVRVLLLVPDEARSGLPNQPFHLGRTRARERSSVWGPERSNKAAERQRELALGLPSVVNLFELASSAYSIYTVSE